MAPQPRIVAPPPAPSPTLVPSAPIVAPALPMNGAPMGYPSAGNTGGGAAPGGKRDASLPQNSSSIFDRWGNLFVEQGGVAPVSGASVISSTNANGSATQATTNERGFFPLGGARKAGGPAEAPTTAITINLPANPDLKGNTANWGTGTLPSVLIALLLPAVQKAREATPMVQVGHVFIGSPSRATVTIKRNGDRTTVDWGDGSPPTDVAREGRAIPATGNSNALGRIIFVGGTVKF